MAKYEESAVDNKIYDPDRIAAQLTDSIQYLYPKIPHSHCNIYRHATQDEEDEARRTS